MNYIAKEFRHMNIEIEMLVDEMQDVASAKFYASARWKDARKRANDSFMISLFGSAKLNHEVEIKRQSTIRWQERLVRITEALNEYSKQQLKHLKNE